MLPCINARPLPQFGLNRHPKIAVVESMGKKVADIDGDGVPDLTHATTCARIIRSVCPEAQISYRRGLPDPSEDLSARWVALAREIEAGTNFDAINYAAGWNVSYTSPFTTSENILQTTLDSLISPKEELNLTPGNLLHHRSRIFEASAKLKKHLKERLIAMQTIVDKGTLVFSSAGDFANEVFKLEGSVPGIQQVGATDANGVKESYSPDNTLINCWEQGTFAITKVEDGYDITGDGKVDVRNREVSGGKPIAERFVGENAMDALFQDKAPATITKVDLLSHLFSPPQLVKMGLIDAKDAAIEKSLGYAAIINQGGRYATFPGFRVKDGKIVYDPDNSGRKNAVSMIYGTSASTSFALGKAVHQKFCLNNKG